MIIYDIPPLFTTKNPILTVELLPIKEMVITITNHSTGEIQYFSPNTYTPFSNHKIATTIVSDE